MVWQTKPCLSSRILLDMEYMSLLTHLKKFLQSTLHYIMKLNLINSNNLESTFLLRLTIALRRINHCSNQQQLINMTLQMFSRQLSKFLLDMV